jgi:hypothetical protein
MSYTLTCNSAFVSCTDVICSASCCNVHGYCTSTFLIANYYNCNFDASYTECSTPCQGNSPNQTTGNPNVTTKV